MIGPQLVTETSWKDATRHCPSPADGGNGHEMDCGLQGMELASGFQQGRKRIPPGAPESRKRTVHSLQDPEDARTEPGGSLQWDSLPTPGS